MSDSQNHLINQTDGNIQSKNIANTTNNSPNRTLVVEGGSKDKYFS